MLSIVIPAHDEETELARTLDALRRALDDAGVPESEREIIVVDAIGGFDERYYASEEIWLSKALRERGEFVILPDAVLTSGRKVRLNSAIGMLWTAIRMLVRGPRGWRGREGLGLWYEGGREVAPAQVQRSETDGCANDVRRS